MAELGNELLYVAPPSMNARQRRMVAAAQTRADVAEAGRELRRAYDLAHPPGRCYWDAANAIWQRMAAVLPR